MEQMQQRHGIQSAGDGHQNRLPAFKQPAILDVLFNALEQIGHALMLLHPPRARTAEISRQPADAVEPLWSVP